MWKVTNDGHRILLGAYFVDFVIAWHVSRPPGTNRPVPDAFRKRLLETFDGT